VLRTSSIRPLRAFPLPRSWAKSGRIYLINQVADRPEHSSDIIDEVNDKDQN